ncbi:glycosylase [Microbacterium sp. 4R-513]|uniref:glycoside hydrolase family 130 protein n=1 Tax=Microbacterium sp. 4R-513 TaxID=2567934 RepID=UPI0013E1D00E|nr:glycosylase [Microbacterium sp. 4R-513]QIG40193.1 glycosylase [Microbacterium sp. 4R-513]
MSLTAHDALLEHDPGRVVTRFFLPGEDPASSDARVDSIVARVLAMSPEALAATAERAAADFSSRHGDAAQTLVAHAEAVVDRSVDDDALSHDQRVVIGSVFTADFAVEGAALCNPSAVPHPSQDGLAAGELRVAVSLRCIGEGHISSIGFAEAVIGADDSWTFGERARPLQRPGIEAGEWSRAHFARALIDSGGHGDLASAVIPTLPERFGYDDLEAAIAGLPHSVSMRPSSSAPLHLLRDLARSAYDAAFPSESPLSARTLLPVTPDEDRGVEDARFVRFTDEDGRETYRATYTAYDGTRIAPRLITSPDLVDFSFHRLTGTGSHNKGMALFPRLVGGRHLALTRLGGESISLASSEDGLVWDDLGPICSPRETWELIQLGNCGSPIETPEGWLVLTHGVGPLRTYSLGAIVLDLDDPSKVIRRTRSPLLQPYGDLADGYVPRVVYSCGAIVHRETLWVPVGVGDSRIRVFSTGLDDLFTALEPEPATASRGA